MSAPCKCGATEAVVRGLICFDCWTKLAAGAPMPPERAPVPAVGQPQEPQTSPNPLHARIVTMEIGEFHQRNGLTFRRNDDGSVRVRIYGNGPDAPPTFDQTIPENEWDSVLRETSWNAIHRRVLHAR